MITGLGTASTDDIHIFFVNHFAPLPGSFGEAFIESVSGAPSGENAIVNAFGSPNKRITAQETGKMLQSN